MAWNSTEGTLLTSLPRQHLLTIYLDWNASVPPAFDEITSGVANVTFNDTGEDNPFARSWFSCLHWIEGTDFAGAGADGHDGGADGDKSCRVCGQEGHFAREVGAQGLIPRCFD